MSADQLSDSAGTSVEGAKTPESEFRGYHHKMTYVHPSNIVKELGVVTKTGWEVVAVAQHQAKGGEESYCLFTKRPMTAGLSINQTKEMRRLAWEAKTHLSFVLEHMPPTLAKSGAREMLQKALDALIKLQSIRE